MYARSFSASAAALSGRSTTNGSPCPARAMPSMRPRFTLAADAEREQVGVVEVLADEAEGLRLDADVAVGDDHDRCATRRLLALGDAVRRAARPPISSVPPPPCSALDVGDGAAAMFAGVAGTEPAGCARAPRPRTAPR